MSDCKNQNHSYEYKNSLKVAVENLAMTKYITCDPSMRVFQEAPRKPLY
jgi:hypothetical protein